MTQAFDQLNLTELLFEQVPVGIAVFDGDLRLRRCNPTWAGFISRYTPTEAGEITPGRSLYELAPGTKADVAPVLRRVLAGETVNLENFRLQSGDVVSYWNASLYPLVEDGRVVGIVDIVSDVTERVEATGALEESAYQDAVYRENARLYAEARRRADETQALFSVQQAITRRLDPDIVLQMIADEARRLTDTEMSAVYLYDGTELEISVVSGTVSEGMLGYRLPLANSIAGQAIADKRPYLVPDVAAASDALMEKELVRRVGARSFIIVPLMAGDEPVGTITVANKRSGSLGPEDERVLTILASGAVIALQNARLFANLEQRKQELEALYRADEELYRHLDLEEVLNALVAVAVEILQADKSSVMVWNKERTRLEVRAHQGFKPETLKKMSFAPGEGMIGRAAAEGGLVVVEDSAQEERVVRRIVDAEAIRSFMHVPLEIKGRVFGVFNVSYQASRHFGEEEERLFVSLAQRAALVIENARLYERAQEAAAAEERTRLARDLHDAVTQTLFSASLIADVLPRLWEKDERAGRQRLQELRELTRGALAEMRMLLLELRPASLTEVSLGDLLRQLANGFIGRSRLPIDLQLDDHPRLPPDVQVALYRIAQEALNNVSKHAGANRAKISLRVVGGVVELRVADDGCGFDPEAVPAHTLGLSIMAERAENIGATLSLTSAPGAGTTVAVRWSPEPVSN